MEMYISPDRVLKVSTKLQYFASLPSRQIALIPGLIGLTPKEVRRRLSAASLLHLEIHYRYSSGYADCPPVDMNAAILGRSAWHQLGGRIGSIFFWVNKSYSRGEVRLLSTDPDAEPDVDFRLLSDSRDMQRMKDAFRMLASLATDPALDNVRTVSFPTTYSDRVRKVSAPGRFNAMQMAAFSALLDAAPFAQSALIHTLVTEGLTLERLVRDDDALEAFLADAVTGTWHASGTCRMGQESDRAAVTDPSGRVHGVRNLRVCDASLMPTVPCANTNIPTVMIAEKIADGIKAERLAS